MSIGKGLACIIVGKILSIGIVQAQVVPAENEKPAASATARQVTPPELPPMEQSWLDF